LFGYSCVDIEIISMPLNKSDKISFADSYIITSPRLFEKLLFFAIAGVR
jgi:hypothetical protein